MPVIFSFTGEKEVGSLIEKEEMERGSISMGVYTYYFQNVGWLLSLVTLLSVLVLSGVNIGNNFWLSAWSEAGLNNEVNLLNIDCGQMARGLMWYFGLHFFVYLKICIYMFDDATGSNNADVKGGFIFG